MCKENYDKIVFEAADNNKYIRKFSFIGKWLFQNKEVTKSKKYSIALTEKMKLLILIHEDDEKPFYEAFDSFDDIVQAEYVPEDILLLIAENEQFVEKLNI